MSTASYNITKTLKTSHLFWDHLGPGQRGQLVSYSHIRAHSPGSLIHSRPKKYLGVILVFPDQVRTYIQSEEGYEVTLFRLGTEDACTLSAACMMQEITLDIFIEAVEESTLLITMAACIHRLIEDNTYMENYTYHRTAERFSDVMWSVGQLLFSSPDKRLVAYLAGEQIKSQTNTISTTHEQVAKNLSTAREVVFGILKYLEKEGTVSLGRETITVMDTRELRKLPA